MTNIAVHDLGAELNELTTLRQTHYQQANENGMVKQVSTIGCYVALCHPAWSLDLCPFSVGAWG